MKKIFCAGLAVILGSTAALAADKIPVSAREGLNLTIYNSNLALVKDKRSVVFKKGLNEIIFPEVSAQMRPETALVTAKGTKVLEQNFNFDMLSYNALLQKSVGKKVKLARTNHLTGEETIEDGELISASAGTVVKVKGRIEGDYPGRVLFQDIPDNLYSDPTLILTMQSEEGGKRPLELAYLTGGLSWKADYVAELNADETELDIKGMVTLTNTSGAEYRQAKLQLMAGTVNQVTAGAGYARSASKSLAVMEMGSADTAMVQEEFADYHLYTLPRLVDVMRNQTKQVDLLSGKTKVAKEYRFLNILPTYAQAQFDKIEKVNPDIRLIWKNDEKSGMGMPLPAGVLRVYKKDKSGSALFAGEDRINHTPKNETLRIKLGKAFDITADAEQFAYEKVSNKEYIATYVIRLKNAKKEDVMVSIDQNLPRGFKLEGESIRNTRNAASAISWKINVPAEGTRELTFKIRVK